MASATGFVKGVHGVRYQVKDVARAVAFYDSPGVHAGTPAAPCVRERRPWRREDPAQRTSGIRIPADAERTAAGTGWVEPRGASRQRLPRCIDSMKAAGAPFPQVRSIPLRWNLVQAGGRYRLRIPTVIQSSCSSPRVNRWRALATGLDCVMRLIDHRAGLGGRQGACERPS